MTCPCGTKWVHGEAVLSKQACAECKLADLESRIGALRAWATRQIEDCRKHEARALWRMHDVADQDTSRARRVALEAVLRRLDGEEAPR